MKRNLRSLEFLHAQKILLSISFLWKWSTRTENIGGFVISNAIFPNSQEGYTKVTPFKMKNIFNMISVGNKKSLIFENRIILREKF